MGSSSRTCCHIVIHGKITGNHGSEFKCQIVIVLKDWVLLLVGLLCNPLRILTNVLYAVSVVIISLYTNLNSSALLYRKDSSVRSNRLSRSLLAYLLLNVVLDVLVSCVLSELNNDLSTLLVSKLNALYLSRCL